MASGDSRRGHSKGGDRRRGGQKNRRGNRSGASVILGLNALQNLREKDPDDIVLDLASTRCLPAFQALLKKSDMTPKMIEVLLEVLARMCDNNSPENFNKLIVELPRSLFVILSLKCYIARLCIPGDMNGNPELFIQHIVKLFSEILKRIPGAFATLPLGDLEQAVDMLSKRGCVSGDVVQHVEQLKVIKEESLEKERRKAELEKQKRIRSRKPAEATGPPPEDFREMTIVPQHNDIFTDKQPYLRKNIVQGAYENLDHYLDVQFRLLREDFLRPLREGILNLVKYGIDEKQGVFKDILVYRNVKILYPVCTNKGLRHHIQFDNSKLKRVKWENSKRLIFGSLLCLSKDHFETFVFATVADRDPKELAQGRLTVHFMDMTIDLQDFSRKNVYEMVETTAYFEAYNPILEGLQQTKDNDLPFQRYLVDCDKDIQEPRYLRRDRSAQVAPSFDFSCILTDNALPTVTAAPLHGRLRRLSLRESKRAARFTEVPVLDLGRWPSMEQLGLDESQYKSLQIALTKEVAVIQGPPGTGKTFLGLKIARLLLNNTKTWIHGEQARVGRRIEVKQTPILVICYTNHALDQFLEGIYDFYGHNENKIVRIGGRSKSEKLKDCNLNAIRQNSSIKTPRYVGRGIAEVYSRLDAVKKKMESSSSVIKKCWQNIVYESTLEKTGVVDPDHFSSLMGPFLDFDGGSPEQGMVVLQWLNLVAGDEWAEQEELVLLRENQELTFDGRQFYYWKELPLGNVDFSLCMNVKTHQAGTIVSNLQEDRRWMNDSKALYVDPTGVVKFVSGENILCESFSRINDDRWHEVAVVYSTEDNSLALYIDKRVQHITNAQLFEENQQYLMKLGAAPLHSGHELEEFVGSIKKIVYYRSTKYSELVRGDAENVEYEIDFMQDQRRIDDDDDTFNNKTSKDALTTAQDDFDVVDPTVLAQGSGGWQVQDKKRARKKIKFKIKKQLQSEDVMSSEEALEVYDVWQLQLEDRWRLYRKWVRDISLLHQNTIASVKNEYDEGMEELEELHNAKNYELLREAHVIGMTTTGAAKHRNLLHRIKPKITIVEEAAEVLESHIVTALTEGCEHLILIGDHKQLRPKPTVFQLGLDYQLDISLFERMVENGMPFACLQAQHRMRPEISVMMRPIYKDLRDHESVRNFERIKGISKNIFFLDHQVQEEPSDENKSHSNIYEAKFIGSLCRYLLQQGYSPSQITVLTPYTGQIFQLKKFVPIEKELRVCVVDNFQGEENEIILLSLVRSQEMTAVDKRNIRRLIGFLAIDNRICVSLSRAKKGFFCIGNMTLMRSANDLWSEILDDIEQRGCVGPSLSLACQNHPTTITHVSNDTDFNKVPNGGCNVPCRARLECGHCCEQICHPTDPNHEEYDCRKKCAKKCTSGHPCQRLCYQDCICMVIVKKVVPHCYHVVPMPCHQDPASFTCPDPCPKQLSCGHACPNKCGEACATKCVEKVWKEWSPCGHIVETQCYVNTANTECPQPCESLLNCEHKCNGTCGACKQGRVHQPCSSKCDRVLFCGHECKVPCTKNCPPCLENCQNRCAHSNCEKKCGQPCKECNELCQWRCEHFKCNKLCGDICDRPRCDKPCQKTLEKCGHRCAGLCGEPCPNKCLICDKEELTEIFFGNEEEEGARFIQLTDCGDVFEVEGMDQYIDLQEKELKKGQSTSIQMIKCPKCTKAIRTSLRYGNVIKVILRDFEGVKNALSSAYQISRSTLVAKVTQVIKSGKLEEEFPDEVNHINETIRRTFLTKEDGDVIENQIQFLKLMVNLKEIITHAESIRSRPKLRKIHSLGRSDNSSEPEVEFMIHEQKMLLQWVMKKRIRFSDQELEEFSEEIDRARLLFSYLALQLEIRKSDIKLTDLETRYMAYVKQKLDPGNKLSVPENDICSRRLRLVTRNKALTVKYTAVTEEEKQAIVKAIGLSQGHWFKCPKGHIYCIGECGGATEESKCPECGSRIGGTQHRLLSDNSLASEMDGARFAAWSDTTNNMGNWDLR